MRRQHEGIFQQKSSLMIEDLGGQARRACPVGRQTGKKWWVYQGNRRRGIIPHFWIIPEVGSNVKHDRDGWGDQVIIHLIWCTDRLRPEARPRISPLPTREVSKAVQAYW